MNLLLSFLLAVFFPQPSCAGEPSPAGQTRPIAPSLSGNSPLYFYGRVNHWADSKSELSRELALMEAGHIDGYMIEMAGWGEDKWSRRWLRRTARRYRWLLGQCRARGLLLFVSVINDNMGKHKYGDTGPLLEAVEPKVQRLMQIVRTNGPQQVIVQPVAETQTDAGRRMEEYALQTLPGFTLVHNGEGGFPKTVPSGFQYRAVHPAHIDSPVPADAFVVSDHGLIIRELTADRSLDGPADSLRLSIWIDKLRQARVPMIGYYVFQRTQMDTTALRVLGEAIRTQKP